MKSGNTTEEQSRVDHNRGEKTKVYHMVSKRDKSWTKQSRADQRRQENKIFSLDRRRVVLSKGDQVVAELFQVEQSKALHNSTELKWFEWGRADHIRAEHIGLWPESSLSPRQASKRISIKHVEVNNFGLEQQHPWHQEWIIVCLQMQSITWLGTLVLLSTTRVESR